MGFKISRFNFCKNSSLNAGKSEYVFFFFFLFVGWKILERILAGRLYNLITKIESVINNDMLNIGVLNVFKDY